MNRVRSREGMHPGGQARWIRGYTPSEHSRREKERERESESERDSDQERESARERQREREREREDAPGRPGSVDSRMYSFSACRSHTFNLFQFER